MCNSQQHNLVRRILIHAVFRQAHMHIHTACPIHHVNYIQPSGEFCHWSQKNEEL